jgi:hypothetical protein
MDILIACFSRTGRTERLAEVLHAEFEKRGHTVARERIEPRKRKSRWNLLARQVYQYPLFALGLLFPRFRRWWLEHYHQPEDDIEPLAYPDVRTFDRVCIGGPKWAVISYPVARYLREVKGLRGKKVGAFATFAGPPFEVFEIELLFVPMGHRLRQAGATLAATVGLSSDYHELFLFPVFKVLSRMVFGRPVGSFSLESDYGRQKIEEFCAAMER